MRTILGMRASQRVSRRRVLATGAAAGGGLTALALAACGGSTNNSGSSTTTNSTNSTKPAAGGTVVIPAGTAAATGAGTAAARATTTQQPKNGGTLSFSIQQATRDVYDPHISVAPAAFIFNFIGNTAMRLNQDGSQIQPELVAKWEVPGDGSQYLLTIQQGVKWHDKPPTNGRALDANDVAYNINRISGQLDPANIAQYARRTTIPFLDKATAVDANTVSVKLTQPSGTFLRGLADYRNQFIPADFLDKGGSFKDAAGLVGTGPYTAVSLIEGQKASFKKNPNYFVPNVPHFDAVEWLYITDPLSLLTALSQGQISYYLSPTKAIRDQAGKVATNAREEKWTFTQKYVVRYNTQVPLFGDPRIRRALQLVHDYKGDNDAVYGAGYWDFAAVMPSAFPDTLQPDEVAKLPGWNPTTKQADIKTAKDLMTAAGYPNGEIKFRFSALASSGQAGDDTLRMLDNWKQVWPGIGANLDLVPDAATLNGRLVKGDFDMYYNIEYSFPDSPLDALTNFGDGGGRNWGKFADPQIESQIQASLREVNVDKRKAILTQLQMSLVQQHMPLFTVSSPRAIDLIDKKVAGMAGFGRRVGGGPYHDTLIWTKDAYFAG